jgi:hypothetical protein
VTDQRSPLNDSEKAWLQWARSIIPGEPPLPWKRGAVVRAAGVFAGGWDKQENFLLISWDGYSLTHPVSGERLIINLDSEGLYDKLSTTDLSFYLPEHEETIAIFGVRGGDGIHVTQDGWISKVLYPWWPHFLLTLDKGGLESNGIKLNWLDGSWIKTGFSPSGKHFAVVGEAGLEIFTRPKPPNPF